jgi:hypothetical protein
METRGLESAVSGPAFAVEKKNEPCKLHGQRSSAPTGGTQCGTYVRCVHCVYTYPVQRGQLTILRIVRRHKGLVHWLTITMFTYGFTRSQMVVNGPFSAAQNIQCVWAASFYRRLRYRKHTVSAMLSQNQRPTNLRRKKL